MILIVCIDLSIFNTKTAMLVFILGLFLSRTRPRGDNGNTTKALQNGVLNISSTRPPGVHQSSTGWQHTPRKPRRRKTSIRIVAMGSIHSYEGFCSEGKEQNLKGSLVWRWNHRIASTTPQASVQIDGGEPKSAAHSIIKCSSWRTFLRSCRAQAGGNQTSLSSPGQNLYLYLLTALRGLQNLSEKPSRAQMFHREHPSFCRSYTIQNRRSRTRQTHRLISLKGYAGDFEV